MPSQPDSEIALFGWRTFYSLLGNGTSSGLASTLLEAKERAESAMIDKCAALAQVTPIVMAHGTFFIESGIICMRDISGDLRWFDPSAGKWVR